MMKAIAIIALALGLEAGFLLTAAVPARPPVEAPRAEIAKTRAAPVPPAASVVRAQPPPVTPGRS